MMGNYDGKFSRSLKNFRNFPSFFINMKSITDLYFMDVVIISFLMSDKWYINPFILGSFFMFLAQ